MVTTGASATSAVPSPPSTGPPPRPPPPAPPPPGLAGQRDVAAGRQRGMDIGRRPADLPAVGAALERQVAGVAEGAEAGGGGRGVERPLRARARRVGLHRPEPQLETWRRERAEERPV